MPNPVTPLNPELEEVDFFQYIYLLLIYPEI